MTVRKRQPQGISGLIGARFRVEREVQGKTLREVATAIGRTINVVRFHENGDVPMRIDDLVVAARFLGVGIEKLV